MGLCRAQQGASNAEELILKDMTYSQMEAWCEKLGKGTSAQPAPGPCQVARAVSVALGLRLSRLNLSLASPSGEKPSRALQLWRWMYYDRFWMRHIDDASDSKHLSFGKTFMEKVQIGHPHAAAEVAGHRVKSLRVSSALDIKQPSCSSMRNSSSLALPYFSSRPVYFDNLPIRSVRRTQPWMEGWSFWMCTRHRTAPVSSCSKSKR